jgi:predicted RNA binding protein YcfA (HicA-like mRNA interferase family)
MKRIELIRHVQREGCIFVREGARHSIYFNPQTNRVSTIPRHNEINDFLAKKICNDLGIHKPIK